MSELQVISTKNLRDNLAEILEQVSIGRQNFIVAKFGRKKALISPITDDFFNDKKVNFSKLAAFGVWKNRQDLKNSAKWVSNLRKKQSFRNK